ncbi:sulfhydryl oxidase 2 isoform X2 [Mercurialis annua]|uniref:sulfhydryl oxidase 2 isoform X2 n=1 Tax=Mercurialis annua TaxID=3986 RepID=UPI00215E5D7E|nr:sulfhydryl oxidase 2 isoform X2 [Mercurialis annua]
MSQTCQLLIVNSIILSLLLCSSDASPLHSFSSSGSRRSILREIISSATVADKPRNDYAVDLNVSIFDSVLRDSPASFAIVEFFANWCPACRNYKPHYEKVARLFNGPDAVHPGVLLMARVDCALKINTKLCDKFSVSHYPMLFWSAPANFVSGSWGPKEDKNEIRVIDDGRTAERLLSWINKQLGRSYGLDDEKFENEQLPSNTSDPGQIARAVYDVEEATANAFEIILEHKMIKSKTRAPLIKFLQLLVAHHPSKRCRKGSAEALINFDDQYPPGGKEDVGVLSTFQICGKEVPRGYWMFCRGSKNDTRGFSCGLWVLLHSLSVRIDDGESQFAFTAICDFVHNFFICEECRQHFVKMCSSIDRPLNTSRDFALWLWETHNKVNRRLMNEEASLGTGDPKFPKIIWPTKQLCSSCYRSNHRREDGEIDWDKDEVYRFLTDYYGKTLVSLYKDKGLLEGEVADGASEELVASTNAVVVPVGAALAIALASCAFGALACYWRSQQKSRKPRRKLELS